MNRKPYAAFFYIIIIVELLVVIITSEPTNRHHRRLIIDKNKVNNNCTIDNINLSQCRTKIINRNRSQSFYIGKYSDVDDNNDDKKVEEKNISSDIIQLSNNSNDNDNYNDDNDDSAIDEGRGKKKRKGMGKMLFMLAAAIKGTLLYAMIHGVALVAGKALVVAKVALALAAAVALKKALEHPDKTSYEIVKHPQHSYAQTHSSSIDYEHHGGFEGHRRRRKRRYVR